MVRRLLAAAGHPVRALRRVRYGAVRLRCGCCGAAGATGAACAHTTWAAREACGSGSVRVPSPAEEAWARELLAQPFDVWE